MSNLDGYISALSVSQSMFLRQLEILNDTIGIGYSVDPDKVAEIESQLETTITECSNIT